jgi:hypothetical protein
MRENTPYFPDVAFPVLQYQQRRYVIFGHPAPGRQSAQLVLRLTAMTAQFKLSFLRFWRNTSNISGKFLLLWDDS